MAVALGLGTGEGHGYLPMPGWVPLCTGSEHTVASDQVPILADNSPGEVSLKATAWVVARDPPGCRGSGHPGASSNRPSYRAPAPPADLIWACHGRLGMENLFHAALHPSRKPRK